MDNIIIRRATIDDLQIVQNLNNSLFELEKENYDSTLVINWPLTEEGRKYFEDLIINKYVVLALVGNVIVGYLAGTIEEKGSYEEIQYGEINNMFINDNYRGYGIGRKLINSFKNYCNDNNIFNLKVTASYKNENAIAFYHRNGFEEFNLTLTMNIDKENKNEI